VAAHGTARPGQLGLAGVWLAPPAHGADPEFLSWFDLVDKPLHADLAVFNACVLASEPASNSAASLSFAAAAVSAGVGNVIAASWPVSDSAASVWVPAFYRILRAHQPDSSVSAMREVQLALRHSRFFRHPYYWAAFAHYSNLKLASTGKSLLRER